MNPEEYFIHLKNALPDLMNRLQECESDMIFLKMETFANYTIEQIKSQNWENLKKCFDFQESKIELVDSLLLNAMNVSFCESLLLGECRFEMNKVKRFMGKKLEKLYDDYETYYNDLGKKK